MTHNRIQLLSFFYTCSHKIDVHINDPLEPALSFRLICDLNESQEFVQQVANYFHVPLSVASDLFEKIKPSVLRSPASDATGAIHRCGKSHTERHALLQAALALLNE